MKRQILLSFLLLGLSLTQTTFAGPRVVVSLPAIHSLVANIMQGVGEPRLLHDQDDHLANTLGPFQKSEVLTADLIIWVGAGLEESLADMLESTPPLHDRTMTLSNTVPLLLKRNFDGIAASRKDSRDLRFWHDPKIAMMAVRQITPTLVRLDPANTERYLDNEIELLKRIKQMSKEIASRFSTQIAIPERVATQFSQYFTNRFVIVTKDSSEAEGTAIKVSTNPVKHTCRHYPEQTPQTANATNYYFEAMKKEADGIQACSAQYTHGEVAKTRDRSSVSG
ncbi:MAG: metal ABC transporter substrate-binding protein [Candidatus Thiodiazotropha sp. (ex Ctena orbiculata)]|uniref:High-affinity zinc uptake system protein ZnuA n=1 Tax=Candidatus Thiodiazotropha taylori TaxID=2792791 RepID=A0A944MCM1_9GAMM|nr:metal ABC transporter substrate-binding protein [Candidatus Thiodiazotropha taylori]MBT2991180.1 metal ABC transporter substrate-binding protein [Candidatus Thiodiazotropha taylori]MBT2998811.1 metal ABC transporter substrate-binding protein [Candidatus Thiodiazotropha taylori]MBT3002313.1 metal ABC transporter substrate-binding protein [Candidatus Thiodiazotropha taylori]MBT3028741.1 metal ABC transporter substrate-binding protein [Candidatus Thiodiazotropha taylori]